MLTHAEHARELKLIRICSAADQDINGGCFNCGWFPQQIQDNVSPDTHVDVSPNPNRCGAYAECWKELGKPEGWLGCLQESGHEGNHKNTTECGYSVMVSPSLGVSSRWRACTKPRRHAGLHMDFRSH